MFYFKFLALGIFNIILYSQVFEAKTSPADKLNNKIKDKLHVCMDGGEAYGASYLITKEHLIKHHTAYKYVILIIITSTNFK